MVLEQLEQLRAERARRAETELDQPLGSIVSATELVEEALWGGPLAN